MYSDCMINIVIIKMCIRDSLSIKCYYATWFFGICLLLYAQLWLGMEKFPARGKCGGRIAFAKEHALVYQLSFTCHCRVYLYIGALG